MTDEEIRALVRDAIARHTGGAARPAAPVHGMPPPFAVVPRHVSHAMFAVPAGADIDGPCVIEPAVQCNHCGYCKSYGH